MSALLEKIMDEVDHQKEVATALEGNIAALLSDDTLWHLWTVTSRDANGRLEGELFGNGVNTKRVYDHFTGDLLQIKSGVAEKLIRDIRYTYNARNSVVSRSDGLKRINETFTYDTLDRLTSWTYNDPKAANINRRYRYDTRGNMTFKTNAGTMSYDGGNRLTKRTHNRQTVSYRYDKNGNMLSGDGRTYHWTHFNKARSVITAKGATHYTYGGNHSRVKKEVNGVTTYYFGRDYEVTVEKVKGKTVRTMRHHLFAGHELVATHKKVLTGGMKQTDTTAYVHRDALGSVDTVTNQVGEIVQQQRYTPFGEAITVAGAKNQFAKSDIRGYTSHENVGDTGLINMNARLYDPLIGRFIQADTMIPDAGTAQDYNRYAYVRNNPMKYSDPSGHFPFLLGLGLFLFSMTTDDPFLQKVTGLAGNIIMGGALSSLGYTAIQNGAILSFIGGTAQGGLKEGLKQGVIGGVTAGLTKGLADKIGHGYKPGPVLGQMVLHGAIAELRGGKFKHGAISALAGKMGSHYGQNYFGPIGTGTEGDRFSRAAVSVMFGGLAAEASGGSFEDGAMQALFVHLFNDAVARGRNKKSPFKLSVFTFEGESKGGHASFGFTYEESGEVHHALLDINGSFKASNGKPVGRMRYFDGVTADEYIGFWTGKGATVAVHNIGLSVQESDSLYAADFQEYVGLLHCAISTSANLGNNLPRFKDLANENKAWTPTGIREYFNSRGYPASLHYPSP